MRPRIPLRIRLDSVDPSRTQSRNGIAERQEIEKLRRSAIREALLFIAFREIVTALSPWKGGALIRHSKDNSRAVRRTQRSAKLHLRKSWRRIALDTHRGDRKRAPFS